MVKKWEGGRVCVCRSWVGWGGVGAQTEPSLGPLPPLTQHTEPSFSLGWMLAWEGEVDTQPSWTAFALFSPTLFPALTSSMNRGSHQL